MIIIEGIELTGYYDYDQKDKQLLSKLTGKGKAEWFKYRVDISLLNPLAIMLQKNTEINHALFINNGFIIAAVSIMLNGIESFGAYLCNDDNDNDCKFYAFITKYMKEWDEKIAKKIGKKHLDEVKKILWKYFRNGIAHSFRIEAGRLDNKISPKRFLLDKDELVVSAEKIYEDFLEAVKSFFNDIFVNESHLDNFIKRFKEIYPC